MPSYRRHVARHPLALPRALRAVRRHALETGPRLPQGFQCLRCGHGIHVGRVVCREFWCLCGVKQS